MWCLFSVAVSCLPVAPLWSALPPRRDSGLYSSAQGHCEGHSLFRLDPLAIARLFGSPFPFLELQAVRFEF